MVNIWELICAEGATTINLGFYGMFAIKVHNIPLEPEATTTAWRYQIYVDGRKSMGMWGRSDLHVGQDLELI